MSSRSPLLLLSGTGGAGTSTLAALTAEALASEGLRVAVIDASGPSEVEPAVSDALQRSLGRILGELGSDPIHSQTWAALPGVAHISVMRAVLDALHNPGIDAVVVDCGPLTRARELVQTPTAIVRLLDSALTPRLAMWRSTGEPESAATVFEALSDARNDVLRMQSALVHRATLMRLVTTAEASSVTCTIAATSAMSVLGIAVDGIIVSRFATDADGWPTDAIDEQAAELDRLRSGVRPVEVWTASTVQAAPPGRSALGPVSVTQVLSEDALWVTRAGNDYLLAVPLAGAASARARAGRQADDLVIDVDGVRRWLPLPPVLRRCQPVEATRTDDGLTIRFVPDPAQWREPAESTS